MIEKDNTTLMIYGYVWSPYLEAMVASKVTYKNKILYWSEDDLLYYDEAENLYSYDFVNDKIQP